MLCKQFEVLRNVLIAIAHLYTWESSTLTENILMYIIMGGLWLSVRQSGLHFVKISKPGFWEDSVFTVLKKLETGTSY